MFRSSQPLFCWEGEPNASRPGIGEHPTVYPGFTSAAGVCPSRAQPTVDAVVRVRRAGQSACARAVVVCHRNHVVVREAALRVSALRGSSAPPRSEPVAEGFAATGVRYSAREPSRIWECEVRAVAVASCCGVCRCPVRREAARRCPQRASAPWVRWQDAERVASCGLGCVTVNREKCGFGFSVAALAAIGDQYEAAEVANNAAQRAAVYTAERGTCSKRPIVRGGREPVCLHSMSERRAPLFG